MLVLVLVLSLSSELLVGRARGSMMIMMLAALLRMLLQSQLSSSSLSRRERALISKLLPPGSYTSMPSSLLLKSLGLHGWWLRLRLRLLLSRHEASSVLMLLLPRSCALLLKSLESNVRLRLPVSSSSSSCAVLPYTLLSGGLWLLLGTCAGSGIVIGVASPLLHLGISARSSVWRLFGSASVASDGLGDAAAIDRGGGSVSS